jgi:hypothetical protein
MASIAPIVIGCIDYLVAYRTIFTRVMFCPKIKLDVFFPARKPQMSAGMLGHHLPVLISSYLAGDNTSSKKLPATEDSIV